MNKSMLYAGLMSILCTSGYAESTDQIRDNVAAAIQANAQLGAAATQRVMLQHEQMLASQTSVPPGTPVPNPQGPEIPGPQGLPTPQNTPPTPTQVQTPSTNTSTSQGTTTTQTQSTTGQTTTTGVKQEPASTQTPTTTTTTVTQPTATQSQGSLDCNYHIPASTTNIDQAMVMKWAEKATAQSFDFDYTTMDTQLAALKACYTDLGWQGFNDALQKSGNLNAIKSQQLMVNSMISGPGQITEVKENQWKVTIPLQVVYQNNKEKLTQPLTINLVVGRKVSGDLGIMQMIAIPRTATTTTTPQPTPTSTGPSSNPVAQPQ
ncbi:DotI/IcmL family type IV secretion protein [Legionella hackeliae]|uniref:IcmL-like protein n=1 Tax=Legionella hackeliae TaxID=449 RepID=A0A0A8UR68_LEGHA|nr:DotI/IcmL family type IV secretion protein [Legionella hackeliae]KTD15267.1 IcmL-like protein [Legionella hackeliae]CEK11365.1 conserved exported protein of unknown function [Legionella hackeliae]STX48138.1 IcmL-like protein [Legionella hackeliae]